MAFRFLPLARTPSHPNNDGVLRGKRKLPSERLDVDDTSPPPMPIPLRVAQDPAPKRKCMYTH